MPLAPGGAESVRLGPVRLPSPSARGTGEAEREPGDEWIEPPSSNRMPPLGCENEALLVVLRRWVRAEFVEEVARV